MKMEEILKLIEAVSASTLTEFKYEENGTETDSGTDRKSDRYDGLFLCTVFTFSCRCGIAGKER